MLKKKEFLAILFVFLSLKLVQSCKQLWDNSCTSNNQCCTKYCDNHNGQWASGVCKTRSSNDGDGDGDDNIPDNGGGGDDNGNGNSGCKPLWDNSCTSNNECCTKYCDNHNGQWAAGVCKTRSNSPDNGNDGDGDDNKNGNGNGNGSDDDGDDNNNGNGNSGCKPLWDNSCTSNNECCTKYCDNHNGQWAAGVCKTRSNSDDNKPDNGSGGDDNGNGDNNGGGGDDNGDDNNNNNNNGNDNGNSGCKPLWDNSCTSNNECCTKYCDNHNGQWAAGVCKTRSNSDDNKPDNGSGGDDNGNGDNNGGGDDDNNKNGNDNGDSGGDVDAKPTSNSLITQSEFKNAVIASGYSQPSSTIYKNFVKLAVSVGKIKTKSELGMFLAHTLHESDGFKAMREYYCYPTFNSGCAYSSGVGIAGKNYFGRGYIQLVSEFFFENLFNLII